MGFWAVFGVLIAFQLISFILNPKPQQAPAATKEKFKFATPQPGQSFILMRGTRDIEGPGIVYYGNVKIRRKKISTGGKK